MKFARPIDVVARRKLRAVFGIGDLFLGFGDRRGQVAALDAEFDRDVAAIVLSINVRGAGFVGLDGDQLFERDSGPRLAVRAGRVDGNPANDFGIIALAFGKAEHDVEKLLALDHPGECAAADGDLHDGLDVGHIDPVTGALMAVDLDLEVGLADDMEEPGIGDAPHFVQDVDHTLAGPLQNCPGRCRRA